MDLLKRIIVALGRDSLDAGLLAYAKMLAGLAPSAVFHFTHVLEKASPPSEAQREIEDAVAQHFGAAGLADCRVVPGNRVDQLLETAVETGASLILVGHHSGLSGRRSLARRLAMKAPCSLWLAPQGAPARLERVLAAVDFSHHSANALHAATALARAAGLDECLALHVYFDTTVTASDEYSDVVRGREEEAFAAFVAPLDLHGVGVTPLFEDSASVSHAISRAVVAHRADLVVMGTRGLSPSASVLLGSESEQTLMETRVPVLVVKESGSRLGLLQALLKRELEAENVRFG
jgi:SulP family sulfate permease